MKKIIILILCFFCVSFSEVGAKQKKHNIPAPKQIIIKDTIETPKLRLYKEEDFGIKFGDDKTTVIDSLKNRPYVRFDPENQRDNGLIFSGGYYLKNFISVISVDFKDNKLEAYVIGFSSDKYRTPQDCYNDVYNNLSSLLEYQYNIEGEMQKNEFDYLWIFSNCMISLSLYENEDVLLTFIKIDL